MRELVYLSVIVAVSISLGGCSSYFYSMLGSNDPAVTKNDTGDFILENDTALISYNFWGENAPITITVYNKLDEPLYVDWERSALVLGDVAVSYDPKVAAVQGNSEGVSFGDTYLWNNRSGSSWSYSQGQFAADIALPRGIPIKNLPF